MILPKLSTNKLGFTLAELLVATAVLAVSLLVTTGFVFSVRTKAILRQQTQQLQSALEYARQQSIAAYKGNQYSIEFSSSGTYTIVPEQTQRQLKKQVSFQTLPPDNSISFSKLTGRPDKNFDIVLTAGNLKTTILVNQNGIITSTQPEKL